MGIEKRWRTDKPPLLNDVVEGVEKSDNPRLKNVVFPINWIVNLEEQIVRLRHFYNANQSAVVKVYFVYVHR